MIKKNRFKKGQSFSIDVLVVVMVVLFGVIFLVANKVNDSSTNGKDIAALQEQVAEQSRIIVDEFKASKIIDEENNIEVPNLLQLDVQKIKEDLNIQNDFCIVFEKDGNLVKIDPENNVTGVGSSSIIVNGVPCKSS